MSPDEAEGYHARQVATFADSAADMVTAVTMTNAEEAIGIARAARAHGVPAVIFFTVETDGRLPDGQPLRAAIERVDAGTGGSVAYFMVNCAHGALRPRLGAVAVLGGCCGTDCRHVDAIGRALDGLTSRLGPPPRAVSLAPMSSRVVAVVAGAALAAGGFVLGRTTADTDAGRDAGVREGRAAGLEEGRALQATGSSPPGTRAAFDAGYAAGANDVFGGFDGGWSLSEPYVITLARGRGAVTYRIDSRRLARRSP